MRLLIVGGGVVGTATGLGFQRLGHQIHVYDISEECLAAKQGLSVMTEWCDIARLIDLVLICVPETEMEQAFRKWLLGFGVGFPVYIRSSVPPGTCRALGKKHLLDVGHNPEFLREAVAEYEFLNPPAIILGDCCEEHGKLMHGLYEPFRVPIHHTTPEVSELTKLAVNGYLTCQVSYWNQVKLLANKLGINSHEVGMLAAHCDDRVSVYGSRMHGWPYGGRCLPKDLRQLISLCDQQGIRGGMFLAIENINKVFQEGVG